MTQVTILDGCPTQNVEALRLPDHDKEGQTVPNLAIHLKFRGPLPERVAIGNMVYHVRPHTQSCAAPAASCFAMATFPAMGVPAARNAVVTMTLTGVSRKTIFCFVVPATVPPPNSAQLASRQCICKNCSITGPILSWTSNEK
ncbi:hypothetical protein E2C01_068421 [Portunus trituberculatus]|uniref:Uncharacterized protein n=1 Tax=Portunus trituberculatus TaxID=210409 RepID=A0A5B7HWF4_PORTR|nr:hypothetical protein [Portunus trituberculatus]